VERGPTSIGARWFLALRMDTDRDGLRCGLANDDCIARLDRGGLCDPIRMGRDTQCRVPVRAVPGTVNDR